MTDFSSADTRDMVRNASSMMLDLFEIASACAQAKALDVEAADELALHIVDKLAHNWAGQQLYVGKSVKSHLRMRQRDLDLYRDFTGHNHAALAAKYKVSTVWVYAVIRRIRQEIQENAQEAQQSFF